MIEKQTGERAAARRIHVIRVIINSSITDCMAIRFGRTKPKSVVISGGALSSTGTEEAPVSDVANANRRKPGSERSRTRRMVMRRRANGVLVARRL